MQLLADVRQYPASRRVPWSNGPDLAEALAAQGIGYLHMPALGGRRQPRPGSPPPAREHESSGGYADHMDTPQFALALDKLKEMAAAHRTVIMCAEALWWRCHRSLI